MLRRIKFHKKTSQTWKIYSTNGFKIQRCKCYPPIVKDNIQASYAFCKEKSTIKCIHITWCHHKRYLFDYLGTVIEVNVSELGLVTQTGKVVWSKYAQVTNNPELDGCINALLLVWILLFINYDKSDFYVNFMLH